MKGKILILLFSVFLIGSACTSSRGSHNSNRRKGEQCDCPKETKVKVKKHRRR